MSPVSAAVLTDLDAFRALERVAQYGSREEQNGSQVGQDLLQPWVHLLGQDPCRGQQDLPLYLLPPSGVRPQRTGALLVVLAVEDQEWEGRETAKSGARFANNIGVASDEQGDQCPGKNFERDRSNQECYS